VKKTSFEGGAVTTTLTLGGAYERRERIAKIKEASSGESAAMFRLW